MKKNLQKKGITIRGTQHKVPSLRKNVSKKSDALFKAKNDQFDVVFNHSLSPDSLVVFSDGYHKVELVPITEQKDIVPIKKKNRVTYPLLFVDADLSYVVTEKGIKEEIIVHDRQDSYNYQFELKLTHLSLDLNDDNMFVFRDSTTNSDVFLMPKMVMYDSGESSSEDILVSIDNQDGKQIMTVVADEKWMNAEHRVFPITIDPQIEIINSDPITISSVGYNGGQQTESGGKIRVGRYKKTQPIESYMYNRLQVTINVLEFLDLISDEREFNCQLKLFHTKPITNNYNNVTEGFAVKFGTVQKAVVQPTASGSISVNITKELKERIAAGNTSNLVFTLEHVNPLGIHLAPGSTSGVTTVGYTDDHMEIYTTNHSNEDFQPQLQIRYIGAGALEAGTPMMQLDNRRSGTLELNPFTGEYTHHHYDARLASGALKIDLKHVYDSAFRMSDLGSSNALGLGKGWKTNIHQRLFKSRYFNNATKGREVIYTDGNGKNHYLYEKWYIEVNGEKQYDQVERDYIYLDSDNKLKINIGGTIHEVKYEVKSDDGLELMLSSSMVSYLDKKRFKKVRTYNVNYLNGLRELVYNESKNTVQIKVARKSYTEYHAGDRDWINQPLAPTHTLASNTFMDLTEYFKPSEINFDTGEAPNTFHLPVLFDGTEYYVNLPYLHYTPLIYWDDFRDLGSSYQKFVRINLNVSDRYEFDENAEINDFISSQDLETVEQQIKSYEDGITDIEKNMISVSEQYDKTNLDLEKQIKNFVRSDATNFLNEGSIKRKITDSNLQSADLNDARYNALTAKNNFVNAISTIKSNLTDISKNMGLLQKKYQEYKQELDHLKDKQIELTKLQKENSVDFIIDKSQNILGFDYEGRLVLIRDAYENQIEVVYKENTEQLTEIITKQGNVILNYDEDGKLEYIIDEQGRKTSFTYSSVGNLTEISYHMIDESLYHTKFTYVNDQITEIIDASKLKISMERNDALQTINLKQSTTAVTISDDGLVNNSSNEKILSHHEISYDIGTAKITDKLTELTTTYTFDYKHRVTNVIGENDGYQSLSFAKYHEDLYEMEVSATNLEIIESISLLDNRLTTGNKGVLFNGNNIRHKIKSDLLMLAVHFDDLDDVSGKTIYLTANVHYATGVKSYTFETPCVVDNEKFIALSIPVDKQKITYLEFIFSASAIVPLKKVELLSASGSSYTYDDDDKLIKTVSGLTTVEYLDYVDDKPLCIKSQDKYGKVVETILMYNALNQETYKEDSEGNVTETYYNDKGQVIESISYHKGAASDKSITRTTYDELGHPVSFDGVLPSKDDVVRHTELSYLKDTDMLSKTKAPNGLVTNFGYDFNTGSLLEKSASVNGYNNKTTYKYQFGLLTSLTHHGLIVKYELDGLGRKKKIYIGNQAMGSITYDDAFMINGKKGSKIVSTYANDRTVEAISDFEGKLQSIKTTVNGQVIENITYTYDTLGKLLTETNQAKPTDKTVITYDQEDRVASQKTTFDGSNDVTEWFSHDEKNRVIEHEIETPNTNRILYYEYDDKNQLTEAYNGSDRLNLSYDILNRVTKKKLTLSQGSGLLTEEFTYLKAEEQATNLIKKHISKIDGYHQDVATYDYDESGNIVRIETDEFETRYAYDKLGRLIREDNKELDKTFIFDYDEGGNILFKKVYAYTLEKPSNRLETKEYTYRSEGWKDQLLSFGGETISYDVMGNPTTYKNQTLSWSKQGRLLAFGSHQYVYNKQGIRVKKTVGGVETKFFLSGTKIIGSTTGSNQLEFIYLGNQAIGIWYNGSKYFFGRNIQGDVISLHEPDGNTVARYIYDAWGNHKVLDDDGVENTNLSFIGNINPIRYRGYYYDVETKLYYLNTRYYDPETGRFISADTLSIIDETQADINGLNLYMYCGNNPVMRIDPSGMAWWNPFTWSQETWTKIGLTVLVVAAVVALSIATAGAGAAVTGMIGGFWGAVIGGAVGGAISGAIGGAALSIISQGITNGYGNIDWGAVGIATLIGAGTGALFGGIVGGFRYVRAVNHLKSNGFSADKIDDIMSSFKGTPKLKTIKSGTTVFRVHGGSAGPVSNWVSPKTYSNPIQAFALKAEWGNTATELSKIVLTENVKVLVGRAASQGLLSGGGIQWFIANLAAMLLL